MARVSKTKPSEKQEWLLHPDKRATMQLPVPIDDGHTAKLNARLTTITAELLAKEAEKREKLKPINDRMAKLREEQKSLVEQIKSGQTTSEVPVEERANFETGEAWMIRNDTGDEVPGTRRALTHSERQTFARRGDELERVPHRRAEGGDEEEEAEDESGGQPEAEEEGEPVAKAADAEALSTDAVTSRSPFQHPVAVRLGESAMHLAPPLQDWCALWPAIGLDVKFFDRGAVMGSARWNDFGGAEQRGGWDRSSDAARVPVTVLDATAGAIIAGDFKRGSREALAEERRAELATSSVSCSGRPQCKNMVPAGRNLAVCDDCTDALNLSGEQRKSPTTEVVGLGEVRAGWGCVVVDGELFFHDGGGARVGGFLWSEQARALVRAPTSKVPELWPDEHQDLLDAVAARVARGELDVAGDVFGAAGAPTGDDSTERKSKTTLYPLPQPEDVKRSLAGWQLAVGQGRAMVRQPDGTLVGPLLWREKKGISDRVDFDVTDEWMDEYGEDVLPAVDVLILSGQVREPFLGYTPPNGGDRGARGEEPDTHAEEGEHLDEAPPTPLNDVELAPTDARAIAEKLNGYAPKVLLLLRARGTALSASVIGLEVRTAKPGAVINRLVKDGLLQVVGDGVSLTRKGAAVAGVIEEIGNQKRKK